MRAFPTWQTCLVIFGLAAFGLSQAGCGGTPAPPPQHETRIKALAILYGQYVNQHRGQSPADEKEFKQFISTRDKETLKNHMVDVDNLDQLFVSPRDNQPYGLAYKVKSSGVPDPSGQSKPVIWERVGSGGQHYVVDGLGKIELISDEEFKKRVPNAK